MPPDLPKSFTNTLTQCLSTLLTACRIAETHQVGDALAQFCALVGSLEQRLTALEAAQEVHPSAAPTQGPSQPVTPIMDRAVALERRVLALEGHPEPLYVPTIIRRIQGLEERVREREPSDMQAASGNGELARKRTHGEDIPRDDIKRPRCEKEEGGSHTGGVSGIDSGLATTSAAPADTAGDAKIMDEHPSNDKHDDQQGYEHDDKDADKDAYHDAAHEQLMDDLLNALNGEAGQDASSHEDNGASQAASQTALDSSSSPAADVETVPRFVIEDVGEPRLGRGLETIHETETSGGPDQDVDMGDGVRETLVNAIVNMADTQPDHRDKLSGTSHKEESGPSSGEEIPEDVVRANPNDDGSGVDKENGTGKPKIDREEDTKPVTNRPMLPPLDIPSTRTPSPPDSSTFTKPQPRQTLIRAASNSVSPTSMFRILSLPPDFAPGAEGDLFPAPPKPQRKRRAASVQAPKGTKLKAPTVAPTALSAQLARAAPSPSAEAEASGSKKAGKAANTAARPTMTTKASHAKALAANVDDEKGPAAAASTAKGNSTSPPKPAATPKGKTRAKAKTATESATSQEPASKGKATRSKAKAAAKSVDTTEPVDGDAEPVNNAESADSGIPKSKAKTRSKSKTVTEPVDDAELADSDAQQTDTTSKPTAKTKGKALSRTKTAKTATDLSDAVDPADTPDVEAAEPVASAPPKAAEKAKGKKRSKAKAVDPGEEPADDDEPVDADAAESGCGSAPKVAPKARSKTRSKGKTTTETADDATEAMDEDEEPEDDAAADSVASRAKSPSKTKAASKKAGSKTKGPASK